MVMQRGPARTRQLTDEYSMRLQTTPVIVATVSPAAKKFEDSKCEANLISARTPGLPHLCSYITKNRRLQVFSSFKGACHE
jgi:hypothetical protein